MPELTQFESGKSTIRYLPANGTAASDRSAVSALSALRSPPARMSASVRSIFAPLFFHLTELTRWGFGGGLPPPKFPFVGHVQRLCRRTWPTKILFSEGLRPLQTSIHTPTA